MNRYSREQDQKFSNGLTCQKKHFPMKSLFSAAVAALLRSTVRTSAVGRQQPFITDRFRPKADTLMWLLTTPRGLSAPARAYGRGSQLATQMESRSVEAKLVVQCCEPTTTDCSCDHWSLRSNSWRTTSLALLPHRCRHAKVFPEPETERARS
ncbi:hypothetical protein D3C78_1518060 [compost metagenome]